MVFRLAAGIKVNERAVSGEMDLKLLAPAKVNLFLKVVGRRDDGYHDILSLIQPISLYDELCLGISDGEGIEVYCDNPGVPGGKGNLACRAAEAFLREVGLKRRITIRITKRIPVGAGLGGGSSDAASVLMGLNEALGTGLEGRRLREMALGLGSDVPFFLLGTPALASGRGEVLEPVELPSYSYVLLNPGFSVSTAWVYNNLDLTKIRENNKLIDLKESVKTFMKEPPGVMDCLENDLEAVTSGRYPAIVGMERVLREAGADGVLMSGSGPTVFGIFLDEHRAQDAYSALKSRLVQPHWVFVAKGL